MVFSRTLNKNEKILANQDPEKASLTLRLSLKAMFEEKVRYTNNGEDGTNSNAFLHAYWASLLAKNISPDWAKQWTDAHEEDHFIIHSQMDIYNNTLGIRNYLEHREKTNDELANWIEEVIDSGQGKRIQNNIIIPTSKEEKRNLNIFELIIESGISLISKLIAGSSHFRNKDGMTPLIFAVSLENTEAVKIVLKHSNLEDYDESEETALFHAITTTSFEIPCLLINAGAQINVQNKQNNTPLMKSVLLKNLAVAKELIRNGADTKIKNSEGFTAYDLAKLEEVEDDFTFLKFT